MTRARLNILCCVGLLIMSVACKRVPDSVIQPEAMAQLLADIEVGQAAVDANRSNFRTDSMRLVVKQSILSKHGVDQATLDSSYSWYAHNPERYMEVNERVIELLEKRLQESAAQLAQTALTAAGDSVDLWSNSRMLLYNERSATEYITFTVDADENSEPGDIYTWRGKFINNLPNAHWGIAATYTDGRVELVDGQAYEEGWNELQFITDSTRQPKQIYGYLKLQSRPGVSVWVDSVQLVRHRLEPEKYNSRFRQRSYY